jgi:hypothetical protein
MLRAFAHAGRPELAPGASQSDGRRFIEHLFAARFVAVRRVLSLALIARAGG